MLKKSEAKETGMEIKVTKGETCGETVLVDEDTGGSLKRIHDNIGCSDIFCFVPYFQKSWNSSLSICVIQGQKP